MTEIQTPNATRSPVTVTAGGGGQAQLYKQIERLELMCARADGEARALRALLPVVVRCPPPRGPGIRAVMRMSKRMRQRWALSALRLCGLLDRDWYLKTYPDVAAAGVDPVLHYLTSGAAERRDPGPHFDTSHYVHLHPDVARAGLNPLLHYLVTGHKEGRSIRPEQNIKRRPDAPSKSKAAPSRFDINSLPHVALGPFQAHRWVAGIGPCQALDCGPHLLRLSRASVLNDLASLPPGRFLIDWIGIQTLPDDDSAREWQGLWSATHMRLNRQIMDACRIALDKGWQIDVTGPVRRSQAPLFATVAGVVTEVSVRGTNPDRVDFLEAAE